MDRETLKTKLKDQFEYKYAVPEAILPAAASVRRALESFAALFGSARADGAPAIRVLHDCAADERTADVILCMPPANDRAPDAEALRSFHQHPHLRFFFHEGGRPNQAVVDVKESSGLLRGGEEQKLGTLAPGDLTDETVMSYAVSWLVHEAGREKARALLARAGITPSFPPPGS